MKIEQLLYITCPFCGSRMKLMAISGTLLRKTYFYKCYTCSTIVEHIEKE